MQESLLSAPYCLFPLLIGLGYLLDSRTTPWARRADEEKAEFERTYSAARSKLDRYADR